uniref:Uncharacterized protein n=1 Tax=Quercus lobata TaxID=97700 RepID=A0A7N2LXD0_QUELO
MMPLHADDLDRRIELLMECKPLQEAKVKTLCDQARAIQIRFRSGEGDLDPKIELSWCDVSDLAANVTDS